MDVDTKKFLEQTVSEELEKEFVKNIVDIVTSFKNPSAKNFVIENAIDYLVYKRLKEYEGKLYG